MPSSPASSPEPKSGFNPLVFPLVASVGIVFLLFSYYRILKQFFCGFRTLNFSRSLAGRRLLNEANPDDPSLQFHSQGLDLSTVHSIPIVQFKGQNEEELSKNCTECAVCLGEFKEGEWLRHLPNCKHAFHVACIDIWFQTHSNCPLCRANISDLTVDHDCSVSMYTLLETLRREDFFQERAAHYQILRSEILHNSALRWDAANANRFV